MRQCDLCFKWFNSLPKTKSEYYFCCWCLTMMNKIKTGGLVAAVSAIIKT